MVRPRTGPVIWIDHTGYIIDNFPTVTQMPNDEIFQTTWTNLADQLEELATELDRVQEIMQGDYDDPVHFEWESFHKTKQDKHQTLDLLLDEVRELDECIQEQNKDRTIELFASLLDDWTESTYRSDRVKGILTFTEEGPLFPLLDPLERTWEEIRASLALLELPSPIVIFVQPKNIIIPTLVVSVQHALIEIIQRDPQRLFSISPRAFEEIIAELFASRGYEVELTQQTRDGGRDIIAVGSSMGIRNRYLIECKRYAPGHNVSIAAVPLFANPVYPIQYNLNVSINETTDPPTATITGSHTCFPSHEIAIGNQVVYKYTPVGINFAVLSACLAAGTVGVEHTVNCSSIPLDGVSKCVN